MLDAHEAQKRIESLRNPTWESHVLAGVSRLPERDRAPARRLFDLDRKEQTPDWASQQERMESVAAHLDALTPQERTAVFASAFPKLASHIERCWTTMRSAPYQHGYHVTPFRAPNTPTISRAARGEWLRIVLYVLRGLDPDAAWLATWAPHLAQYWGLDQLGLLLAGVIDGGGDEADAVMQTLIDSANGDHEIGGMGRHVTRALLSCGRPDAWHYVEKLLLAAQRQEGLRQAVLESADLAHPGAFERMLKLILDENLVRFASVARAVDVWFAMRGDSASTGVIKTAVERALRYLQDDTARAAALAGDDEEEAYMALWATAFRDVEEAMPLAEGLMKHRKPELRFVGIWSLLLFGLRDANARALPGLDDDDLRIVHLAVSAATNRELVGETKADVFAKLEARLEQIPAKPTTLKPILWPWLAFKFQRSDVADAMAAWANDGHWPRMIEHVPSMSPIGRRKFVLSLKGMNPLPDGAQDLLFRLAGDTSPSVREQAVELLSKQDIRPDEAPRLESLLARKASDLRRGVLALLKKLPDDAVLQSIDRLVTTKNKPQRLAGLELLSILAADGRVVEQARRRARDYAAERGDLPDDERTLLGPLLGQRSADRPTLDDGLGLIDHSKRTTPHPPEDRRVPLVTPAVVRLLASLDDLVHAYRETPIRLKDFDGEREVLIGNTWSLRGNRRGHSQQSSDDAMPLADVWRRWDQDRDDAMRDPDGCEILRALPIMHGFGVNEDSESTGLIAATGVEPKELRYATVVLDILNWLSLQQPASQRIGFLVTAAQTSLSRIPREDLVRWLRGPVTLYTVWLDLAWNELQEYRSEATDEQIAAVVRLLHWRDRPMDVEGRPLITRETIETQRKRDEEELSQYDRLTSAITWRFRGPYSLRRFLDTQQLAEGLRLGVLNEHDALDTIIGPDHRLPDWGFGGLQSIRELTGRKLHPAVKTHPPLADLIDRVRERVLDVELARGEEPTEATDAALGIRHAPGARTLVRCLNAIGDAGLRRGHIGYRPDGGRDRRSVLSHLIRATAPTEEDTPESFAAAVREAAIPSDRLIDTALYAPQWSRHVEHALGWDGFEDAVWWIYAHTKDQQWSVDHETREGWTAEVAERTPLTAELLMDGGVDVAWFDRAYRKLTKKRWAQLYDAAKHASSGAGHKRAQLFADAMLGLVKKKELVERITKKRHQDAARALGLLPLAKGAAREKDLLSRYEVLQEFRRTGRKFGSQRQTSEKRAIEVAQENLARTAGYADPLRLQWAMEAKAIADLAAGPLTATAGAVTVTLAVTDAGEPELTVTKNGKPLAGLPAAARKDKRVAELRDRRTTLARQVSRMRQSLEQMMCRGEAFTAEELGQLMAHPLMRPMLERLIFIGDNIAGFPRKKGKLLEDAAGRAEPVRKSERLRLAHPHDLLQRGDWSAWQRDCFRSECVQPFKQAFRELYVLTETERQDATFSRRYAGQQVNPRQALALLGGRGWITLPEEGVRKTFHEQSLSVWLGFAEGFHTPAEVDGLTIEEVRFSRTGDWRPLSVDQVPPLIFSEAMRDVDLVVSVAHRGGVDPEASASTIEMRADLLRETLAALEIDNVRVENNHALIRGQFAEYTVHLGSAVAHVMPGGALVLVPVHSQHRGRLFLPFADDDPKTAEVMSKVLMLARDREIKDPNLLQQIRILH